MTYQRTKHSFPTQAIDTNVANQHRDLAECPKYAVPERSMCLPTDHRRSTSLTQSAPRAGLPPLPLRRRMQPLPTIGPADSIKESGLRVREGPTAGGDYTLPDYAAGRPANPADSAVTLALSRNLVLNRRRENRAGRGPFVMSSDSFRTCNFAPNRIYSWSGSGPELFTTARPLPPRIAGRPTHRAMPLTNGAAHRLGPWLA